MNILSYNSELKRKAFHCASIVFPLIYLFCPKLTMIIILMICTGIAICIDTSRHYNPAIQGVVEKFFSSIMREQERSGNFKLSGVSYMFLGFFTTCVLFSKGCAIAAFLVLIISDTAAAVVGKAAGTTFRDGKSLEGAFAFFITAFLIGMLSYTFCPYDATFISIAIAAAVTAAAEYYSNTLKVDDNLMIPLLFGFMISFLGFLA